MRNIVLASVAAIALVPASAFAQSATVTFSTNQTSFTLPSDWQNTQTVGGQTYAANNTVNLTTLPSGETYVNQGTYGRTAFYRQQYSVILGNMDASGGNWWFIRDIVGQNTPLSALPASGTWTYTGRSLTHDMDVAPSREGDLTYTVNLAARTGSGSITNITYNHGSSYDYVGTVTLKSAAIALQSDGTVGVKNGAASFTSTNSLVNAWYALAAPSPKYDLALYGPNGEEIAGAVKFSKSIGSFGFAGVR